MSIRQVSLRRGTCGHCSMACRCCFRCYCTAVAVAAAAIRQFTYQKLIIINYLRLNVKETVRLSIILSPIWLRNLITIECEMKKFYGIENLIRTRTPNNKNNVRSRWGPVSGSKIWGLNIISYSPFPFISPFLHLKVVVGLVVTLLGLSTKLLYIEPG